MDGRIVKAHANALKLANVALKTPSSGLNIRRAQLAASPPSTESEKSQDDSESPSKDKDDDEVVTPNLGARKLAMKRKIRERTSSEEDIPLFERQKRMRAEARDEEDQSSTDSNATIIYDPTELDNRNLKDQSSPDSDATEIYDPMSDGEQEMRKDSELQPTTSDNIADEEANENPREMDCEEITIENESKNVGNEHKCVFVCEVKPKSQRITRKTRERRCPASGRENNFQVEHLLRSVANMIGQNNVKTKQILKAVTDAIE